MLGWRWGRRVGSRGRRWLVRESVGMPFKLCISTSRHSDGTGIPGVLVSGSARQTLAEGGDVRHCRTVSSPERFTEYLY